MERTRDALTEVKYDPLDTVSTGRASLELKTTPVVELAPPNELIESKVMLLLATETETTPDVAAGVRDEVILLLMNAVVGRLCEADMDPDKAAVFDANAPEVVIVCIERTLVLAGNETEENTEVVMGNE